MSFRRMGGGWRVIGTGGWERGDFGNCGEHGGHEEYEGVWGS